MNRTVDIAVVIAVHNEEKVVHALLERTVDSLAEFGRTFEIVLVDDGSTDHTPRIARRFERTDHRVHVVELDGNHGQVNALACGLFSGVVKGTTTVTLDGDLQDPPAAIADLIDALERSGAQIANACRGKRHESLPRWCASRAVHWLARAATGARIADFGGNFRAYQRSVIEAMRPHWQRDTPLLPLALSLGYPITEVVIDRDERPAGQSSYDGRKLVAVFGSIVRTLPGAASRLGIAGATLLLAAASVLWLAGGSGGWQRGSTVALCAGLVAGCGFAGDWIKARRQPAPPPMFPIRQGARVGPERPR